MALVIYPHNIGSNGARTLANAIGNRTRRVRANGTYIPRRTDTIINWGNGASPPFMQRGRPARILNKFEAVSIATNKIRSFEAFQAQGTPIPEWTRSRDTAAQWLSGGSKVVCRVLLNASQGRGIVVSENPDQLVDAPLYVKYWPKEHEYRVHVAGGRAIAVAEKRRMRRERRPVERMYGIRSHANGWAFCYNDVQVSDPIKHTAITACANLGLDFGGVDIAANRAGSIVVFEINTAPGLDHHSAIDGYAQAFAAIR